MTQPYGAMPVDLDPGDVTDRPVPAWPGSSDAQTALVRQVMNETEATGLIATVNQEAIQ